LLIDGPFAACALTSSEDIRIAEAIARLNGPFDEIHFDYSPAVHELIDI
jgi:hypothetical protein